MMRKDVIHMLYLGAPERRRRYHLRVPPRPTSTFDQLLSTNVPRLHLVSASLPRIESIFFWGQLSNIGVTSPSTSLPVGALLFSTFLLLRLSTPHFLARVLQ